MKKTLLFFVLGLFSLSGYSQSFHGVMSHYMFSGPYSNPSLAGIKEFGTSITTQVSNSGFKNEGNRNSGLWRQRYGLDQSLFQGRGGLQMQWSQSEVSVMYHLTEASLAYSHGFKLGKDAVLRAGIGSSINSNVITSISPSLTQGPVQFKEGSDLNVSFRAGLSVHFSKVYGALGVFNALFQNIKAMDNVKFANQTMFTAEIGAKLPIFTKQIKKWSWSAQPYVKLYNEGAMEFIAGSFLNYGLLQIGADIGSFGASHVSAGFHSRYIRVNYAYSLATSGIRYYQGSKHEVALRFILPNKTESANYMGQVYRGF